MLNLLNAIANFNEQLLFGKSKSFELLVVCLNLQCDLLEDFFVLFRGFSTLNTTRLLLKSHFKFVYLFLDGVHLGLDLNRLLQNRVSLDRQLITLIGCQTMQHHGLRLSDSRLLSLLLKLLVCSFGLVQTLL